MVVVVVIGDIVACCVLLLLMIISVSAKAPPVLFLVLVAVAFAGVMGVTEKRRWKKVDFLSSHAVSIGARGRFKKVRTAFSIPASSDGSRETGGPPPARWSHIRPK